MSDDGAMEVIFDPNCDLPYDFVLHKDGKVQRVIHDVRPYREAIDAESTIREAGGRVPEGMPQIEGYAVQLSEG